MDELRRKCMGISLEFNRILPRDKEIPISEYLNYEGVPFCHYQTYQKMIQGNYDYDYQYLEMFEKKKLSFQYNYDVHLSVNEKYMQIKEAIEFIDIDALATYINEAKMLLKGLEEVYPHKIDSFILLQIERHYIHNEYLNDQIIRVLSWILKFVSRKKRTILIHLIYFNAHKKDRTISTLKNTFDKLPLFDDNELLIGLVITRQMIYEKEFNLALLCVKELERECKKTKNYSRLTEIYQNMIAIYGSLKEQEKVEDYVGKLLELLNNHYEINKVALRRSEYYLGMCSYSDHNFEIAYEFMKKNIKANPDSAHLQLFYLSILSYRGEENTVDFKRIYLQKANPSYKVFLRYFVYKIKCTSQKKLVAYIMEKVMPLINEDYILEAYVFKQELYLLNAKEEFTVFEQKMKNLNYVILHNWEEVFLNW